MSYGPMSMVCGWIHSAAAPLRVPSPSSDDSVLPESSLTSQSTEWLSRSPYSLFGLAPSLNWYALRLGLWGMCGVAKAMRGDGRGEVKGEAVPVWDFARVKAGGAMPKPGGGLTMRGEWLLTGVGARFCCQGAGDGRRMTVWRLGGGELEVLPASR